MNQNLLSRVLEFLKRKMWNKRWQRVATCLSAVAVFGVTYALILPAVTMTKNGPALEAEETLTWSGEELSVKVTAKSEPGEPDKTVVITAEGEGADLSDSYTFNEDGICIITDEAGREIELHRSIREEDVKNAKGDVVSRVDYWFVLAANEETSFTLELTDEVDPNRFAAIVETVKQTAEEQPAENATDSNAAKTAVEKAKAATASNAAAAAATASNASVVTETHDDNFVEIMDGPVENNLDPAEYLDEEEATEITAEVKLSAGIGSDYRDAVSDAERNADKRGNAQVRFRWQQVNTRASADSRLTWSDDSANIAVFYDKKAMIPERAYLDVREIEKDSDEYEEYLAQTKAAVNTGSNAAKEVNYVRFFDITIMDGEEKVEPAVPVKVVITYNEKISIPKDGDLNVVHFDEENDEIKVFTPKDIDDKKEVGALGFTADSFSVYAVVRVGTITVEHLASNGKTYNVTVTYGSDAEIPEGASLEVTEFAPDSEEYNKAYGTVVADLEAQNKMVDPETFGFAALDISIMKDGAEIEPAAPVQVNIGIKNLPGVADLGEIKDSLEIQHHVETENGVIVETVSSGKTDDIAFKTESFSTYTITWTDIPAPQVYIRWFSGSTQAGIAVRYVEVDENNKIIKNIPFPRNVYTTTNNDGMEKRFNRPADGDTSHHSLDFASPAGYLGGTFQGVYYTKAGDELSNEINWVECRYDTKKPCTSANTRHTFISLGKDDTAIAQDLEAGRNAWNYCAATIYVAYKDVKGGYEDQITVHHGYMENGEFKEFDETPWMANDKAASDGIFYLIHDFEGYRFESAHLGTPDGTHIQPWLRSTDHIQYNPNARKGTTAGWINIPLDADNKNQVYVIYQKVNPTEGGAAHIEGESGRELLEPTVRKESKDNGDGTRTISLSVTGQAVEMEYKKLADIIMVVDVSSSMSGDYMDKTKQAVDTLARKLLPKTNKEGKPLNRMAYIRFSSGAVVDMTLNENTDNVEANLQKYLQYVTKTGIGLGHDTNWELGLTLANEMEVDEDRATFVIFLTDGNPTARSSRGVANGTTNPLTNEAIRNDGIRCYPEYEVFGNGSGDSTGNNYNCALNVAKDIVGRNKYFYTIGVGNVSRLNRFADAVDASQPAGQDRVGHYEAKNAEDLETIFNEIYKQISEVTGWADVKAEDGITSLTSTAKKSTLANVDGDFEYWIADPPANWSTMTDVERSNYKPADTAYKKWAINQTECNPAKYENGTVVWDMGDKFMLQDGYTYKVTFRAWPSQRAYDLLADLNNGLPYGDSKYTADEWAQVDETTHALKTNDKEQKVTGSYATYKDGVLEIPEGAEARTFTKQYGTVDPLTMDDNTLSVRKVWKNDNDSHPLFDISMNITRDNDGNVFSQDRTLTPESPVWDDIHIACGLLKVKADNSIIPYETGHDYKLKETMPDDEGRYWEFDADVCHPMVISYVDGNNKVLSKTKKMLVKAEKPAGMTKDHYTDGTDEYFKIGSNYYKAVALPHDELTATNSRKSFIDLSKTVEGGYISGDKFKVEFTVTDDNAPLVDGKKNIYFSVVASPSNAWQENVETDAVKQVIDEKPYYVFESGTKCYLNIQPGWNVRFLNLSTDTTFEFEETDTGDGYEFIKSGLEGRESDKAKVTGKVEESNHVYKVAYTNKAIRKPVKFLKQNGENKEALNGAAFELLKIEQGHDIKMYLKDTKDTTGSYDAYTPDQVLASYNNQHPGETPADQVTDDILTEMGFKKEFTISDGDAGVVLMIPYGRANKYKLKETKAPEGFIILEEITFDLDEAGNVQNASPANAVKITGKTETDPAQVVVYNTPGTPLPHTGGPGALAYTLGGLVLLIASAVMYGFRRRHEERRSA